MGVLPAFVAKTPKGRMKPKPRGAKVRNAIQ